MSAPLYRGKAQLPSPPGERKWTLAKTIVIYLEMCALCLGLLYGFLYWLHSRDERIERRTRLAMAQKYQKAFGACRDVMILADSMERGGAPWSEEMAILAEAWREQQREVGK